MAFLWARASRGWPYVALAWLSCGALGRREHRAAVRRGFGGGGGGGPGGAEEPSRGRGAPCRLPKFEEPGEAVVLVCATGSARGGMARRRVFFHSRSQPRAPTTGEGVRGRRPGGGREGCASVAREFADATKRRQKRIFERRGTADLIAKSLNNYPVNTLHACKRRARRAHAQASGSDRHTPNYKAVSTTTASCRPPRQNKKKRYRGPERTTPST